MTAEQLERELKISERAAADGRKESPPSTATQLSATETLIVNRVEGVLNQHSNEMLGVGSGQDFTTLPQDLETLAGEPQTILTQFRAKKARAQSAVGIELNSAQTDLARAYRDYRAFRIQHKLTETEPSYDNVFWRKVFFLALLFTIEVAANGWVIGQASPGGLVQGWTTALMISVLVVLTGTLLGAGPWRYMNYRGPGGALHKLWAIPAMVVGSGLLLLFAFYIAHYRFALSHTTLDAPVPDNILSSIAATPFEPFQQLESLVLFTIALLIGIFAIARGAHWDEPYPGYGARHRRMEGARELTEEIASRLSQDIDTAKQEADQALAEVASKSQTSIGALRQAIARTQDTGAEWDYTSNAIVEAGRDAVRTYRDVNADARQTEEPTYFDRDPFGSKNLPSSREVLESLQAAFSRATANITACKSNIAGARAQLEAEYHSFYDDEMTPFLRNIADNATVTVRTEFADITPAPSREAHRTVEQPQEEEALALTVLPDEDEPRPLSFRRRRSARS